MKWCGKRLVLILTVNTLVDYTAGNNGLKLNNTTPHPAPCMRCFGSNDRPTHRLSYFSNDRPTPAVLFQQHISFAQILHLNCIIVTFDAALSSLSTLSTLSTCLPCLPVYPVYLSTRPPFPFNPVYLSTCLPVYPSTCLPCLPVYLSTRPPFPFNPVYLSTCLPVYLSTCLPTYASASTPAGFQTRYPAAGHAGHSRPRPGRLPAASNTAF